MKRATLIKPSFLIYLMLQICVQHVVAQWNGSFAIAPLSNNYAFALNQLPGQIKVLYPATYNTSAVIHYQWYTSPTILPDANFLPISGATQDNYTPGAVTQTTFYKLKATDQYGSYTFSNTVKIQLVSVNYENQNYIREHDVLTPGATTWQAVDIMPVTQNLQLNADGLPVTQKKQTTTYVDGLGRSVEQVAREAATPPAGNTLWGDVVSYFAYDIYGRQPKKYLPYTIQYTSAAGTESGKYKAAASTDQAQYYNNLFGDAYPYATITFENNPLNRMSKLKEPGSAWLNTVSSGIYDVNDGTATDEVKIFSIGYNSGDVPSILGTYSANTLYKRTYTDENNHKVIEYTNSLGQLILSKTEISTTHSTAYSGWICVYSIYDDFGLLRYRIQPEAIKYFDTNGWDFTTTAGQNILNEMCFRYEYDAKGRNILKKAPGAQPLQMLYDSRDRLVFMQDGNQALKSPGEWTINLYDELDRVTLTALYHTTETVPQLQTDINNAVSNTTTTITSGTPATLTLTSRDVSINLYAAQSNITFNPGFASGTSDNFTAQIDASVTTGTVSILNNPVSAGNLNDAGVTTILKYLFYDDYTYASAKTFDNAYDNTSAYGTSDPNLIAITSSKRTLSYSTGSKVRVLGTNTFLVSTEYYDEKGRSAQTLEDNIKQGFDVTTVQYHFDGRVLSTHTKHTTSGSGYSAFGILTKNVFDIIGRVSSIQKKYGSNAFKTVSSYDMDDMGRLKTKHLSPGFSNGNDLESLSYTYNIHDQITGINKDYALKAGTYDKWSHFFGLYMGYDNSDGVFNAGQLDGHITGLLWNTQGDDAQRKYDYTYDFAGRLTSAVFKEKATTASAWDNSKMDFSVTGTGGASSKIGYDLNGNLLNMLQRGVIPGNAAPVDIDKLTYTYSANSNRLLKVKDGTAQTSTNGLSGDFTDGTNGANNDYIYDANGNVVTDLNKNAKDLGGVAGNGISYNFLDKPEQIRLSGKGTVKIVYDADGTKLQKIFTPENGTATVTTTYINEFVYIQNDVKYINFEEGRLRVIQPVSQGNGYDALVIDGSNVSLPNSLEGVYDYFIRDYQGNVRMILTEETHNGSNQCTMETSRASTEDAIFQGSANEVENTRFAVSSIPGQSTGNGWQNPAIANQVSRLGNLASSKTGPNVLLRVMAGDQLTATTLYYFQNAVTNTSRTTSLPQDVLNALISAIGGSNQTNTLVKGASGNISTQLGGSAPFNSIIEPDATNITGNNPKAYLTVLFFDERFNLVSDGTTFLRVPVNQAGNSYANLTLSNIKAPKNGYAYVYLSNESDEPVYFDNFNVSLNRGRIIEEDHYYAFGLKIAAISSVKAPDINEGNINNKNLYNDKELIDEADLDWYDYGFRNYDPQIGRFLQLDPLTDYYPELTPYQYASDEPIANIDLDGLEGQLANVTVYATTKVASKGGGWFSKLVDVATDFIPFVGGAKEIIKGIKEGDWLAVAEGAVSIALDAVSLGNASIAKGLAKAAVKEVAEVAGREAVEQVGKSTLKKTIEKIAAKVGVKAVKEVIKKVINRGAGEGEVSKSPGPKKYEGGGCFIAGTKVLTKNGLLNIEDIRVGDSVWAYSDSLHKEKLQRVYITVVRNTQRLYYINVESVQIVTTKEHPFFVNGQWVEARNLKANDTLTIFGISKKVIKAISYKDTTAKVYNFGVENFRSYYVSSLSILVHNTTNNCFTPDQQALTSLIDEQLRTNESRTGKKSLTNGQADDALTMAQDANKNATRQLEVRDDRFSKGKNSPPGHTKHEGSNGHVHVGNAGKGHIPVDN